MNNDARSQFVTVNGLGLHYLEWGRGDGLPLLLLHGLRGFAADWEPVAREFAAERRVIALDQRGRGESDWGPQANYYTEFYAVTSKHLSMKLA